MGCCSIIPEATVTPAMPPKSTGANNAASDHMNGGAATQSAPRDIIDLENLIITVPA